MIALLLFAVVFGGFGIYKYNIGKESESWPKVSGEVTSSTLSRTTSDGKTKYAPSVKYNFKVDGADYTGNEISLVTSYSKKTKADAVLDKYPSGKKVDVYYDPVDPSRSILEPGMTASVYYILAAALACILLFVAVLVSYLKK